MGIDWRFFLGLFFIYLGFNIRIINIKDKEETEKNGF
jgi:hypothetical protein